jgi:hypothetical protein
MRGKSVTVNVRMPKGKRGYGTKRRSRRGPWQSLKSTGWVRGSADSVAKFGPTRVQATPEQLAMRKAWHYTGNGLYHGRGGFWGDLWNKTSGVRGAIGDWARKQGGVVGGLGQISGALGIGDYQTGEMVVNNDIVNGGAGQGIPEFNPGPNEIMVSHKEYVCDIFGPETAGTFQNQTFGLNPGLASTFPWLAQIAANYDEYTFVQMIFTFRSTVTDFVAANGQVGSIIMATQYNANDTPFASKQDAMEYDGAVSGKCSEKILHGVECDPAKLSGSPGKYTRAGPAPPGEDLKTYDAGTLNVSVSNTPEPFSNQALGELWVSYTVHLRKPKFFVTRGQNILKDVFVGKGTGGTQDLNTATIGVGQQNRIGGILVPSYYGRGDGQTPEGPQFPLTAGVLYYVFPHTFSGTVEATWQSGTASNSQGTQCAIAASSAMGIQGVPDFYNVGSWTDTQSTQSVNYQTVRRHLKVTSPTSAQASGANDNVLILTNAAASGISSFMLDIAVYNTGINYATTPQPIIENPVTGLVETWP